jgi:hypothetical protein
MGRYPQLSCNNDGWVVMVFNCPWFNGTKIYTIAGLIDNDNIKWIQEPQYMSDGHYAKVAINDSKVVVEVHQSWWWNTLWYSIGTLDEQAKTIKWSVKDHAFESGDCNPAVALSNDGTVIIVYEQCKKTFYRVGEVKKDATEITWHGSGAEDHELFDIPTKEPSIGMNENGLVVVAANASGVKNDKIVLHIGTLEKNHSITWKDFDLALSEDVSGYTPVVAINKHNHIISVHMTKKLYVMYGVINEDGRRIEWSEQGKPLQFDPRGSYPAVTLNSKGQVVRMHEIGRRFILYYEVGNFSIS